MVRRLNKQQTGACPFQRSHNCWRYGPSAVLPRNTWPFPPAAGLRPCVQVERRPPDLPPVPARGSGRNRNTPASSQYWLHQAAFRTSAIPAETAPAAVRRAAENQYRGTPGYRPGCGFGAWNDRALRQTQLPARPCRNGGDAGAFPVLLQSLPHPRLSRQRCQRGKVPKSSAQSQPRTIPPATGANHQYAIWVGCPARIRTSIDGIRIRSLAIRRRGNEERASNPRPQGGQGGFAARPGLRHAAADLTHAAPHLP
ncbi:MAG: hypothetical protein RIQ99_1211 [Pseudomonadota bacterium]